jgi:protein phosphatase
MMRLVPDGNIKLGMAGTMLSHPGCVREINEDTVAYVIPGDGDPTGRRGALALVADGMGGHAAGEIASRIAAYTVLRVYYELEGSPPEVLGRSLAAAHQAIRNHSQAEPECAGMGTTCTVLVVRDGAAYLAHVGDSRAYLWRDDILHQISEDHSLVAEMVRQGTLTKEEAAQSPQRNIITRALGSEASAEPLVFSEGLPVRRGDVFVLCSDGLTDVVDDHTISETVAHQPPPEACQTLLDAALAAGGPDNISVGVFVIGGSAPVATEMRSTRPIAIREHPS